MRQKFRFCSSWVLTYGEDQTIFSAQDEKRIPLNFLIYKASKTKGDTRKRMIDVIITIASKMEEFNNTTEDKAKRYQ